MPIIQHLGTAFASGAVLVGSPLSYPRPNKPEAALMVARPNPATNPKAKAEINKCPCAVVSGKARTVSSLASCQ